VESPLIRVQPGRAAQLVLGRAQRALPTDGSLPVRWRSSGGGAVLSGPWLLRALVVLPRSHALAQEGLAATALWYGDVHRGWLHEQGIADAAFYRGPTLHHWACFAGRGPGELLVGERKIVGIAQTWKRRYVLLSAATLLAPSPWHLLCRAMGRPAADAALLSARTTSAQDCLAAPVDPLAWARGLHTALQLAMPPS
jgi:lipoate-protein ligase A